MGPYQNPEVVDLIYLPHMSHICIPDGCIYVISPMWYPYSPHMSCNTPSGTLRKPRCEISAQMRQVITIWAPHTVVWLDKPSHNTCLNYVPHAQADQERHKNTNFRSYSRRTLFDLPQTLHADREFFDPMHGFACRGENADFWPQTH